MFSPHVFQDERSKPTLTKKKKTHWGGGGWKGREGGSCRVIEENKKRLRCYKKSGRTFQTAAFALSECASVKQQHDQVHSCSSQSFILSFKFPTIYTSLDQMAGVGGDRVLCPTSSFRRRGIEALPVWIQSWNSAQRRKKRYYTMYYI